jgi:O-antigen/teichoic acid export membrane protein
VSIATKVAGQSSIFIIGNVFTLVFGFLFQIYLVKNLGAEGLGLFGLIDAAVASIVTLLGLGVAQTALRFLPEHIVKQEYAKAYSLVRMGAYLLALLGILGVAVVIILVPWLITVRADLGAFRIEIISAALLIPLGLLLYFCSQVLRGFHDVRYMVYGTSFLQLTVKLVIAIPVLWLGYDVLGYIWAVVVSTTIALVWMAVGVKKHLSKLPAINKGAKVKDTNWLAYSRVMYGYALLTFWSAPLDRFFVGYIAGVGGVGVLMICKLLYSLPGIFLQMFLSIVAPMISAANAVGNIEEVGHIYQMTTDWLVRISLPLIIFLLVFATPTLQFFGEEFALEGSVLLRLLLLAQFINLLCGPIGSILNMCGLEKTMFRISIASTLISAGIMVVAVYLLGIVGVGLSVLFGVVFSNLAALRAAQVSLKIRWWNRRYLHWLLPITITVVVAFILSSYVSHPAGLVATVCMLYAVFHASQWLIHGFNTDDQQVWLSLKRKHFSGAAE